MSEAPATGIHHGIPFEAYLEWDAISNSSLQPALRSMAHYREHQPIEETPAMRLGTLVHSGRFEPDLVGRRYAVMPNFENQVRRPDGSEYDKPKLTSAYRELVDEFQGKIRAKAKQQQAEITIVTQSQYDDMEGMVAALAADERATGYLTGGDYEVAIVARDPETGLLCKGRVDHLHLRGRRIADLKTCQDLSRFESVIEDRSYHRQLAFYADMLTWLGKPAMKELLIVGVESSRPYCVRSAPLDDEAIEAGRDEYRRILKSIANGIKSKVWPGYESPEKWRLPGRRKSSEPVSVVIGGKRMKLS